MTRPTVLVKLGGSVLTNKSSTGPPRFRAVRARGLCEALARAHPRMDLAVVLGAGSWGHPQALRHRVGAQRLVGAARTRAAKEIRASVAELRRRFCEVALQVGLPTVPLAASSIFEARRPNLEPLRWMVQGRLVPVTGGDVIADRRLGLRILSGDEIAVHFLEALRPRLVVFATDVPGVSVGGRVVERLARKDVARFIPGVASGGDATGGMQGKLRQSLEILELGVPVRIVDGRAPQTLLRALRGQNAGTLLSP